MLNKILIILLILSLFNIGCKTGNTKQTSTTQISNLINVPIREHTIQALLWQQKSGEYKALCHQAFNLAKMQLDEALALKKTSLKPIAIVTDIDETVLNNSPYNARMVKHDFNYTSATWSKWVKEAKAKPVPGALNFFKYAAKNNITIYYLSNRKDNLKKETISNLKAMGFPNVDEAHVLLKKETSGKEIRRQFISKTHDIFMLLGDNLSDFSELFDNISTTKRNELVEEMYFKFGRKFIVFPNPMYGDWETKGIYESNYNWSEKQKDSIRKTKLRVN